MCRTESHKNCLVTSRHLASPHFGGSPTLPLPSAHMHFSPNLTRARSDPPYLFNTLAPRSCRDAGWYHWTPFMHRPLVSRTSDSIYRGLVLLHLTIYA